MENASGWPDAPLRILSLEEALRKRPGMSTDMVLTMLIEYIEKTVPATDPLARAAQTAKELRSLAPQHKIQVVNWMRGTNLLKDTPYTGEPELQGSVSDALRIAADLFERGLEVMLRRRPDGTIMIWVDDHHFTQR